MCSPTVGALLGAGSVSPDEAAPGTAACRRRAAACGYHAEAVLELRVVGDRLRRVARRDREVLRRRRTRSTPRCVFVAKIVAQLALQLAVAARVVGVLRAGPALEELQAADGVAEVLPERLLRLAMKSTWPSLDLVDLVADAFAHAGGAGRAALVVVGLVAGDLALRALVGLPALDPVPVHVGGGVATGRVSSCAALAGLARADHGGQDAERADQRAGVDADRGVLGDVAEALVVASRRRRCRPRCRSAMPCAGRSLYGPVSP